MRRGYGRVGSVHIADRNEKPIAIVQSVHTIASTHPIER